MRGAGYRSAKFDILYCSKKKQGKRKTNWHDLLTPSGFMFLSATWVLYGFVCFSCFPALSTAAFGNHMKLPIFLRSKIGHRLHPQGEGFQSDCLVWHQVFVLYWNQQRNKSAQCFKFCWRYFQEVSSRVECSIGKDISYMLYFFIYDMELFVCVCYVLYIDVLHVLQDGTAVDGGFIHLRSLDSRTTRVIDPWVLPGLHPYDQTPLWILWKFRSPIPSFC